MGTVTSINKKPLKTFDIAVRSVKTHVVHVKVQAYDLESAENIACNKVDELFDNIDTLTPPIFTDCLFYNC